MLKKKNDQTSGQENLDYFVKNQRDSASKIINEIQDSLEGYVEKENNLMKQRLKIGRKALKLKSFLETNNEKNWSKVCKKIFKTKRNRIDEAIAIANAVDGGVSEECSYSVLFYLGQGINSQNKARKKVILNIIGANEIVNKSGKNISLKDVSFRDLKYRIDEDLNEGNELNNVDDENWDEDEEEDEKEEEDEEEDDDESEENDEGKEEDGDNDTERKKSKNRTGISKGGKKKNRLVHPRTPTIITAIQDKATKTGLTLLTKKIKEKVEMKKQVIKLTLDEGSQLMAFLDEVLSLLDNAEDIE